MTPARKRNLKRLLAPRHVAVIGGESAAIAAKQCDAFGYEGPVWGVNARRHSLGGNPCFRCVTHLPEPPDAVFLAVPREAVIGIVSKLRDFGAGGVVCFAAGFAETGADGLKQERALSAAAGDLALVGPNCFGLIDSRSGLALWPYGHGCVRRESGVAVISQSGMFASNLTMAQRSLPISSVVSCGNQAVLAIEDFMDLFVDDPAISAIGLYIEELRDISAFARLALRAAQRKLPIVALKAGGSAIGQELTMGHTGSISKAHDLYRALFRRLGIVTVDDPVQMVETLKMLTLAGVPRGRRVAVFTGSGGDAVMAADLGATFGLKFPDLSPTRSRALRTLLPFTEKPANPLDLTHHLWGQPAVTEVVRTMIGADCDAALLVQDYPRPDLGISIREDREDARRFALAARDAGVPAAICSAMPENLDPETRDFIAGLGVAPLQGIASAVQAIALAATYGERLAHKDDLETLLPLPALPSPAGRSQRLDEFSAKQRLAAAGIAVPEGRLTSLEHAASVAGDLGFPVFFKIAHPDLTHKSEAGLLAGPLHNAEEADRAVARLTRSVQSHCPPLRKAMCLVERAIPDAVAEILVSIRLEGKFGAAMVLASGGIYTEIINDAQTLLLPADRGEILQAVSALRSWPLLQGYRGRPPGDVPALGDVLEKLAALVLHGPDPIPAVEINPMLILPEGVVAADALMAAQGD